jgi:rRNA maturation endonuclease Nob1
MNYWFVRRKIASLSAVWQSHKHVKISVACLEVMSVQCFMVYTHHLCAKCGSEQTRRNGGSQEHA